MWFSHEQLDGLRTYISAPPSVTIDDFSGKNNKTIVFQAFYNDQKTVFKTFDAQPLDRYIRTANLDMFNIMDNNKTNARMQRVAIAA